MTKRHIFGLIAPVLVITALVGGFVFTGTALAPEALASGAQFNTHPQDFPVLEVSNYTRNPGCSSCWSHSISGVQAGETISFVFYWHNTGDVSATNTYLKLILNDSGNGIDANGRVIADNASPVFGTARVNFASGVQNPSLTFVGSEFYKDSSVDPTGEDALPNGQSGEEVAEAGPGVYVGNTPADPQGTFQHDGQFVVRYRVEADDIPESTPTFVVEPSSDTVNVDQTAQYRSFYDADGPGGQSRQDVTGSSSWTSLNTSIATSLGSGLFRGRAEGTATVRANYSGLSDTATLHVNDDGGCDFDAATLRIAPSSDTINVDETARFRAFYDGDGACDDESEREVTSSAAWSSLNTGIATSLGAGSFRGRAEGTATIRASFQGASDTATLRVNDNGTGCDFDAATLRIAPSSDTINVDQTAHFRAFYDPDGDCADQSERDITTSASWSSLNTGIATSLGAGNFRGRAEGTATVRASYQSATDTATLRVNDDDDGGDCDFDDATLRIAPSSDTIDVDDTADFRAFYDEDGPDCDDEREDDVTDVASWSSSNSSIASSRGEGEFEGNREGSVTVRASYRGESDTASLRVRDNGNDDDDDDDNDCDGDESLLIIPSFGSTNVGGTFSFRALHDPDGPGCSDSGDRDVTSATNWSSLSTGTASSLGSGTFRGNSTGIAGIRASYSGRTASAQLQVVGPGIVLPPPPVILPPPPGIITPPPTIIAPPPGIVLPAVATQGVQCVIVTPSIDVTELRPGVEFVYTTFYRNDCTFSLNDAILRVYLPNEVDFLASSNPYFIREGQKFSYPLGPLDPGEQGSVAIRGYVRKDAHLGDSLLFTSIMEFQDFRNRNQNTTSYLSAVLGQNINKPLTASISDTLGEFFRQPLAWMLLLILIVVLVVWAILSRRPRVTERTTTVTSTTDRHDDPLRGLRNA